MAHARLGPPRRRRRCLRPAVAPALARRTTITTTTITTTSTASHSPPPPRRRRLTSKGILGVGVAAGLLPCPSALVVLLSAIALHRVGLGLALIVAFSVGLAATITAIGLVAVLRRGAPSGGSRSTGRSSRALPP